MELIFMPECNLDPIVRNLDHVVISLLGNLLSKLNLHSLQKIVITGEGMADYTAALQQHGSELDSHINITNSSNLQGAAVVIHGVRPDNQIEQIFFIKDFIYELFVLGLFIMENPEQTNGDASQGAIGLSFLMHEIGHAIEYQTSYENYGYHAPDKVFDLRYEYEEYVRYEAMQLWSEYYAERIAQSVVSEYVQNAMHDLHDVCEYLSSERYPEQLNAQLNHSYRVCYFLVHYIASLHCRSEEFPLLESITEYSQLSGYQESFQSISNTLLDLFSRYGRWDFESDSQLLVDAYKMLIAYEQIAYSNQ